MSEEKNYSTDYLLDRVSELELIPFFPKDDEGDRRLQLIARVIDRMVKNKAELDELVKLAITEMEDWDRSGGLVAVRAIYTRMMHNESMNHPAGPIPAEQLKKLLPADVVKFYLPSEEPDTEGPPIIPELPELAMPDPASAVQPKKLKPPKNYEQLKKWFDQRRVVEAKTEGPTQ